jgi:hypothetical protein
MQRSRTSARSRNPAGRRSAAASASTSLDLGTGAQEVSRTGKQLDRHRERAVSVDWYPHFRYVVDIRGIHVHKTTSFFHELPPYFHGFIFLSVDAFLITCPASPFFSSLSN